MTSLVDKAILLGVVNRPPMLEKDMYDSWKSIMDLYMLNIQHGRMILESIENGPLLWLTVEENEATNIILQGLPPEVYALVSTHKVAKKLWERIQMLMQGTSVTKQEMECKMYDEFDKLAYRKGESPRDFYLIFLMLLNDMNIYNMKLEQFQVNTKFLNTLPPDWSKFVIDVKLVRDMHTTNVDQLHAYLGQHEYHTNEGKGHMSKKCIKPKRKIDEAWFKDKVLLVQAQANVQVLHEEELEFLVDPRIAETQSTQYVIVLMENLSYDGSDNLVEDNKNVNEILTAELERYKDQVRILKEQNNVDKATESYARSLKIDNLKHTRSEHLKENESLEQMVTLLKNDFQKKESRNIDRELALEKQETLMLEDESRSKMLQKQKDPMMSKKKVNTKPVDYAALNQLSQDFETRFVPQTELSAEQAFWSQNSRNYEEPNHSTSTTIDEVPKELPKVSMVNSSLKKLKFHLASFDMELFNSFDQFLIDELTEVQNVFNQIEQAVKKHCVEKNKFQDKMKDVLKENERLLEQAISIDIVNLVVNANENYAVNLLTNASVSHPQGNTKKDRIQQTQSRANKNKLEDHPRNVRPSLNNKKSVFNTKAISSVPNSKLNVNSNLKCATCNGCLFFDHHDSCVLEFINSVNARVKSKSAKKTFCDSDLEVAFRQHTCFICNLDGVDLLPRSRGNNLYTLSLRDMMESSPTCPLSKASKTKSLFWHRRLSDLNFGAFNHLARQGLVRESVNGKKYILIIVDDYYQFMWVKCLRSKDEARDFIIKFLKMIQVGISHETSVARSPQQNDVIE
nr:hypothetical protein [Tanacetum cinerariifolium]